MKGINHKYVELLKSTFKKYEKIDVIEKPMKPAEDVKLVVESAPDKIETMAPKKRSRHSDHNHDNAISGNKVTRKSHSNKLHTQKSFTSEEDELLRRAISSGKKIIPKDMALKLGRSESSVRMRLIKLQRTGTSRKFRKSFTLEEDYKIVDAALRHFKTCPSLQECNISDADQLAISLGRNRQSVFHRWDKQLRIWLMGYYTGTLNLDIKLMLANFLAEKFDSINAINWDSLTLHKEFSGHTAASLQLIFHSYLVSSASRHLKVDHTTLTLKQIMDDAQDTYKVSNVREKVKKRQMKIIEYFENIVNKNNIKITM